MFFSEPWLRNIGMTLFTNIETLIAGIATVTASSSPTKELKKIWDQLNSWKKVTDFLKDQYLVSRWAWIFDLVSLGSLYVYIALLFSFTYYGIARVSGVLYSWTDALIASLFFPFFVTGPPKLPVSRILGGLHCSMMQVHDS
jgi:hypothetical protein